MNLSIINPATIGATVALVMLLCMIDWRELW